MTEVAAEMRYTEREAWEFVRRIGLLGLNFRNMKLARFSRSNFEEARDRAKQSMAPRARTGVLAHVAAAGVKKVAKPRESVEVRIAKLRKT